MSYGEGSIREKTRPDGKSYNPKRWQICVSYTVEVVQEDGTTTTERKSIQKTVRGTKTHAKEVLEQIKARHDEQGREIDEFQQAINATETAKPKATTLTDMIETWNTARKTAGKASERTIREDRKWLERIEAYLGDKPIGSITAQMVEQTYAAIRKKHDLSGTTMKHLHTLLKNVFQKAVDYDLIPKGPCHFVTAPKREEPKRRSLSQEEGIRLLEAIDKTKMEEYEAMGEKEERGYARDRNALRGIHRVSNIIAVRIGLATGMRRGEVIGLVWKNVDLTRGTIRVCQAATIAGKIKTPKTQAASERSPSTPSPRSTFRTGRPARRPSSPRSASLPTARPRFVARMWVIGTKVCNGLHCLPCQSPTDHALELIHANFPIGTKACNVSP